MKRRVLVFHQSAELYGSDRSLLDLLIGLDRDRYEFIICLPEHGELEVELCKHGFEVQVIPIIKVSRRLFSISSLIGLPLESWRSFRSINQIINGRVIDFCYSNTLAVLGGAIWAFLKRKPHIWHVREIIQKPLVISLLFRLLARFFSTYVICNSIQTLGWLTGQSNPSQHNRVVWNGVATSNALKLSNGHVKVKTDLGFNPSLPLILLVGRINAWKGQDLLIDAVDILVAQGQSDFSVAFVGSAPPGQPYFMTKLKNRIADRLFYTNIHVIEFTNDISNYYAAADIAVVPSREPEPFGRVAIEAMAAGLPVVAAKHGGLMEIIEDEVTGLLFQPNEAAALASSLKRLLQSGELRNKMGSAGRQRQIKLFSLETYRNNVVAVFDSIPQCR